MKIIKLFAALPILLLWSCKQDDQTKNIEKLPLLMNAFFDGVQRKDIDKIKSVTTNDFLLYGHGKILTYDSLVGLIKGFPDLKTEHKLSDFNIDIDNKVANMTYVNHYTVNDSTPATKNFLESAGFRNEQGIWKIRFIHSSESK